VDGVADAALLQAVGVNSAGFVLRRGSRHESVAAAQTALYRVLGVAARPDGAFGPGTERLVRRFQQQAGLPVTGRIDTATWQALAAAAAR
jgi:peptidoglycan hydrolase-like protein with peptidoglycan-binding domain